MTLHQAPPTEGLRSKTPTPTSRDQHEPGGLSEKGPPFPPHKWGCGQRLRDGGRPSQLQQDNQGISVILQAQFSEGGGHGAGTQQPPKPDQTLRPWCSPVALLVPRSCQQPFWLNRGLVSNLGRTLELIINQIIDMRLCLFLNCGKTYIKLPS